MQVQTRFTDAEWQSLLRVPVMAFIVTAAADGDVDQKEIGAFSKELAEAALFKDELARAVFASLASGLQQAFEACPKDAEGVLRDLEAAGRLIDAKTPEHAQEFKQAVLLICKNVSEASGGGFLGRGKKMSDKEATAMVLVAAALGMKTS